MPDRPDIPPLRSAGFPTSGIAPGGPVWPGGPPDSAWLAEDAEPEINIMEYVHLLWRHRWMIAAVVALCVLVGGAWSFTRPKLYKATTRIAFEQAPQIIKSQVYSGPSWWELQQFVKDQTQVLKTRRLAERVAEKLGLSGSPEFQGGDPAAMLLASVKVENVKDTNILELSMVGRDPDKVAEWLNVYVQEYIAINIEDNLNRTRKVYQVIQEKLDPLRKQLEASEQKLISFKESEDAFLVGDQDKNVITEQVNTLTEEYARAKAERISLETKLAALRGLHAGNLLESTLPGVLNDPTIRGLRDQKAAAEVELADKLREYKPAHPVIKELKARIAQLDQKIEAQIATIMDSLQTDYAIRKKHEQALFAALQKLRNQTIELSKQNLEYQKIRHEYEENKTFYEQMLRRSKETDISSSAALNNVRVIDPARPPNGPFRPNPPRALALSLILGLFLGIGLVLGLDYIDQTVRTPEDVERYLGLEVLGAVPRYSDETSHMTREIFQSLRTAVMMAAREETSQVLMVTSAAPGEGKTSTAYNLAKALAMGGAKVLVIDADLRKPRFHKIINAKNVRGLTSLVLGERDPRDVIHTLADMPNLDIVTSGPLPPNPPEMFSKSSFKRMLDRAREHYQWIIIDTPPVTSVTDAVICSQHADMVLLVVRYGQAKRAAIINALRQLGRAGARLAGVVLNAVDLERDSYYYTYYYTYYHYGYGENGTALSGGKKKAKKGA